MTWESICCLQNCQLWVQSKKNHRKRKEIEHYKRIAAALLKNGVLVCFQDEKWVELLPVVERCWTKKGKQLKIPTLGYNKRVNLFITLCWPKKNIIWNTFSRRRNIEFRKHLSTITAYAKRHKIKKIIFFIDHASYHKTPEVKKFFKQHSIFKVKFLGKKDPNSNPVEGLVNKRIASAINVNRYHENLNALKQHAKKVLQKYNVIYTTQLNNKKKY